MKGNRYFLNTALTVVVFVAAMAAVVVKAFFPQIIIPKLGIPEMVLLSLIALLADHYLAGSTKRCWFCIVPMSLLAFGLLPLVTRLVLPLDSLWLGLKGCAAFTLTTLLYTSIQERLSSGPKAKLAPVLSALGLYLASQAFMGL